MFDAPIPEDVLFFLYTLLTFFLGYFLPFIHDIIFFFLCHLIYFYFYFIFSIIIFLFVIIILPYPDFSSLSVLLQFLIILIRTRLTCFMSSYIFLYVRQVSPCHWPSVQPFLFACTVRRSF